MFDDILRPKRKSIWIEPGVYLTLSCKECGECETSKVTDNWNFKTIWTCERCTTRKFRKEMDII
jgi:hypothetical protein